MYVGVSGADKPIIHSLRREWNIHSFERTIFFGKQLGA